MSRVIFLNHPQRLIDFTPGEESFIEQGVLEHRYGLAKEQIASILEDRRLRVRAAKWARRKAAFVNWYGVAGQVLVIACAWMVITGLVLGNRPAWLFQHARGVAAMRKRIATALILSAGFIYLAGAFINLSWAWWSVVGAYERGWAVLCYLPVAAAVASFSVVARLAG